MRVGADNDHPEREPTAGQVMTGTGQPEPAATGAPPGGPPSPGGSRTRTAFLGAATALLVTAAAAVSVFLIRPGASQPPQVSGIPANIPASLANLMEVTPLSHARAPGFTLTDQRGHTMSLADLRGKVIVLEFMDSHCTDICPFVAQEFVDAYHDLGPLAGKVVFAAINVNQYYRSVRAVAAFSREQELTTIPSWHFFTGPVQALRAAWRAYNIEVEAPNPNADILHSSAVFFIDASGAERYLASPQVDHTAKGTAYLPADQLASWGRGIAALARDIVH